MTQQLDPSRRTLIKLLSNASLLPLAGGGVAASLLSACGGGNADSQSPQGTTKLLGITATSAFTYPGLTPNFDAAIAGLNLAEDMRFGSSAVASGTPVGVTIKTHSELASFFYPLQGVFNASGGHQSGTGPTTINSELQRYASQFNNLNHVFEADGLRLQAVLGAGHYDSYLRGSIVNTGNGYNAGAEGVSAPTHLVDIGLVAADLPNIELGTCVAGAGGGIGVIVAKDAVAGTITFEAVSSGIRQAFKQAHHITFTKFAFSRIAADVVNGTTTTIQFKTPIASTVVAGMVALGIKCWTSDVNTNYKGFFSAYGSPKVLSISADRLSVTFDSKVNFSSTLTALNPNGGLSGDGVLFVPGLTSGQIWAKRAYGPQQSNHSVQAIEVEISMPAMPQFSGGGYYTKVAVEAAMTSAPGTLWGYWPAVWLYNFKPLGNITGYSLTGSEVDMLEVFTHLWGGQSTWTGYLHTQPYTRQVAMQAGSTTIARNGGTWKASSSVASGLQTPNTAQLLMPTPIASATKRTVGIIWTADKVLHYLDGIPVSESNWSVDTQYPHQLGINLACGSLSFNYVAALMFPQNDSQATSQFLKIHSIKTWEL